MSQPVLSDLDFGSAARIQNLPDAVSAQQPATFAQLSAAIEGLKQKDPVVVRSQSNTNLASPGATIDGVTMTSGDRVLIANQTSQPENGIYIFNGAAAAMTRSLDANTGPELVNALVPVTSGSDSGKTFRQTASSITLGTTNIVFVQFGTSASQATETSPGIAELATQAETDAGTDDLRIVTPLKLANWAGRVKKFSATFGDGASTQFDVTHNLNTNDVQVRVYRLSDNATILCDVKNQTVNTVRLNFASAVASNALRCVVIG